MRRYSIPLHSGSPTQEAVDRIPSHFSSAWNWWAVY